MQDNLILQVKEISKNFSRASGAVIDGISFSLEEGKILGLLGSSGCGKTTLLRTIAGFERPSQGTIVLKGRIVSDEKTFLPPEKRHTGMVFQDYALFPHLTIFDNIAFGIRQVKEKKKRVKEVLQLVGLEGLEKRYPHQLSGGQQQRIALARALAPRPSLILLDEPLSNLDVQVRQRLRHEIRHILKATGISAIFVTHDQEEALAICDTIGVMNKGKLEQLDTPENIYTYPASRFVAEFVTRANFLPAQREGDAWRTELGTWESNKSFELLKGEVMLKEEDLGLKPDEDSDLIVCDRQFLGREYRYCVQTPSGNQIHARTDIKTSIAIGTKVTIITQNHLVQVFAK
ncbi:MAG: Fe(3+) ions import ATP-binding protein FbpC 2 [Chroococcopsis gigantea SAG 12.99]|nr:Fe(3+) ions import ATP-binding protein FbpC 2 [Chroococcopsis gigantea SAG 12.99]